MGNRTKETAELSKEDEELLRKIEWGYFANRREALLFRSITDNSYKYFRKATKINWKADHIIRFSEGEFFHDEAELQELRSIFIEGGIKVLSDFLGSLVNHVTYFDCVARQTEKNDCSKLAKNQLVSLLERYLKAALYAQNFLAPMVVIDKILSNMILEQLPDATEEKRQAWLGILAYPLKENEHTKEERSFYNLAEAYNTKKFDVLLGNHLKRFSWIGARGYNWRYTWKREDIEERLKNLFVQHKDPDEMLNNLDSIRKERKAATKKLLKELGIKRTSSPYKLILLAKEMAYRRTWRTDIIYGAGCRARNLFHEVAERAGIDEDDVAYFTFKEVLRMARTGKPTLTKEELGRRKEYFVLLTMNNSFRVLSGKRWRRLREIVDRKIGDANEIKGSIAFPGKIKGIVKVVYSGDDIKKVHIGDIMVAVMTFPHFVPAMERAAAFVTDEGGILCHAAIVSREMKKPCIIGTRVATKILKDGDLVELDADKGIARKIK